MFNWNCHLRSNPIHADWQVGLMHVSLFALLF